MAHAADRRTQKTKKALKDTLVDFLQKRALQDITIREITEAADVSRGTFYLHFTDIYDLYGAVEKEVVQGITAIVSEQLEQNAPEDLYAMISGVFDYFSQHSRACEALLNTDSAAFLAHVFESNKPKSRTVWATLRGDTETARSYSYDFIAYGFAGILKKWLQGGKQQSPHELAQIIHSMMSGCLAPKTP